jgi:hypothetical protein
MPARDPRLDPQPGDRVIAVVPSTRLKIPMPRARRVIMHSQNGTITYERLYHSHRGRCIRGKKSCSLKAWRSWCRRNKAEVKEE